MSDHPAVLVDLYFFGAPDIPDICRPIVQELDSLKYKRKSLQERLQNASSSQKPDLIDAIEEVNTQIYTKDQELIQCIKNAYTPKPVISSGWYPLGGNLSHNISAITNQNGRLEVFARGGDNALYHIWQTSPGGGWSNWDSLHISIYGNAAITSNSDGGYKVFVTEKDVSNEIISYLDLSSDGIWSTTNRLSWQIGNPHVISNADGRLEVFAVKTSERTLYHIWQTSPGSSRWSEWHSLGGLIIPHEHVRLARNADGRLEVFVIGDNTSLYNIRQTSPSGSWGSWNYRNGTQLQRNSLAVSQNADGRLEVFVIGGDGALYRQWQTSPGGSWSQWDYRGGKHLVGSRLEVSRNADGRLEVFVIGSDGALYHQWQTSPGGPMTLWYKRGGTQIQRESPRVARNADGRLEVFAIGADNALYHIWQTSPGGGWSNA